MENFNQIESDILSKIKNVTNQSTYEKIKTEIFGKKGIITELFKKVGNLDQSQRKEYASKLNSLKTKIIEILEKNSVHYDELGIVNDNDLIIDEKSKVSIDDLNKSHNIWLNNFMSK